MIARRPHSCAASHGAALPLNAAYTSDEFQFFLSDANADLVIMQDEPPAGIVDACKALVDQTATRCEQWRAAHAT